MAAVMTPVQRSFVAAGRRATLGTIAPDGSPRLVPVCFALAPAADDRDDDPPTIWTPLDEKPKQAADPRTLARVRDLLARPAVTLLVDRWDEDWTRLAWVRVYGTAKLVEPGPGETDEHTRAVAALRVKYPQYGSHALDSRPIIRVSVDRVVAWGDASGS